MRSVGSCLHMTGQREGRAQDTACLECWSRISAMVSCRHEPPRSSRKPVWSGELPFPLLSGIYRCAVPLLQGLIPHLTNFLSSTIIEPPTIGGDDTCFLIPPTPLCPPLGKANPSTPHCMADDDLPLLPVTVHGVDKPWKPAKNGRLNACCIAERQVLKTEMPTALRSVSAKT